MMYFVNKSNFITNYFVIFLIIFILFWSQNIFAEMSFSNAQKNNNSRKFIQMNNIIGNNMKSTHKNSINRKKSLEELSNEYSEIYLNHFLNSINDPNKISKFNSSFAEKQFRRMLNQEFAHIMSNSKTGVNQMIYNSLKNKIKDKK